MVGSCEVDLIDWAMFFGPFVKLHPTVLLRQFVYIADEWKTWYC